MFFGDTFIIHTDEMASFEFTSETTFRIIYNTPPYRMLDDKPFTQDVTGTVEQVAAFKQKLADMAEIQRLSIEATKLRWQAKIQKWQDEL